MGDRTEGGKFAVRGAAAFLARARAARAGCRGEGWGRGRAGGGCVGRLGAREGGWEGVRGELEAENTAEFAEASGRIRGSTVSALMTRENEKN